MVRYKRAGIGTLRAIHRGMNKQTVRVKKISLKSLDALIAAGYIVIFV